MNNCKYCLKECKSIQSLRGHERLCKLNPNFEENYKKQIERTSKGIKEYYKNKVDSNPLNQTKIYNLICSKCGKEYQLNLKIRLYNRGCYPKTCSSKCAHSRKISNEQKKKQSEAAKQERLHTCPKCGKQFIHKGTSIYQIFCKTCKEVLKIKSKSKNIGLHKINCERCKKEIFVKAEQAKYCYECCEYFNKKPYQLYHEDGKKLISEKTKQKLSNLSKQLMAEGKIKPWQSRNIKSYAEKFFHKVLSLNNIQYENEVPESGYFLDFVIRTPKGSIDLEIDGKQHWTDKDREKHDIIRDQKLSSLGYIVYRIPWNSLDTNDGKEIMKEKIQKFIKFYKQCYK